MATIECVPNVSEGRRADVINGLANSLRSVAGLRVLGVQSDAVHNRSVFTLAGDAAALAAGVSKLFEGAVAAIDLRTHTRDALIVLKNQSRRHRRVIVVNTDVARSRIGLRLADTVNQLRRNPLAQERN